MTDRSVVDEDWEYQRLRLPSAVSRRNAATVLAVQAEYAGWELRGVRLYSDGTRKVMLRRPRGQGLPGLSI
jgi:hypothetical protein